MFKSLMGKAALATAALGGFLLFAGATGAQAHDREDCYRRVEYTENRLQDAIYHHGYYSRQANHWRHERHEAAERCERYRWQHEREWREHHRGDWDRY